MKRVSWIVVIGTVLIATTYFWRRNLTANDDTTRPPQNLVSIPPGGPEDIVVRTIEFKWPEDKATWGQVLWDAFANKPEEERFSQNRTRGWKKNFDIYAESLVRKAKGQALDENSLRLILAKLKNDSNPKVAYLPVGAYWTEFDGKHGWIVVMKWENGLDDSELADSYLLSHIQIVLIDSTSFETIANAMCG